jgi:hypothetical protein
VVVGEARGQQQPVDRLGLGVELEAVAVGVSAFSRRLKLAPPPTAVSCMSLRR